MMAMVTQTATRSVSGALLLILASCGGEQSGPEAELRAWVDEMHRAAEAKDRESMLEGIAASYADARGNDRNDISDLLRLYFLRANRVEFVPAIDSIDVSAGTAADVALTVGIAGTDRGRFALRADAYRFELELVRADGNWQLIAARWAELGQAVR